MQRKDDGGRDNDVSCTVMERSAKGSDRKRDAIAHKHRHMTAELTALRTQISLFAGVCLFLSVCHVRRPLQPNSLPTLGKPRLLCAQCFDDGPSLPDSPLHEEEVAKSGPISGGGVLQMDFPVVVSGSAPSSRHMCQFQGTICAYGSGCLSSETVQEGPFLLQSAPRPARRPVATVAASTKSQEGQLATSYCLVSSEKKESHTWASDVKAAGMTTLCSTHVSRCFIGEPDRMLGLGPMLQITCGVGFAILTHHAEGSCYMQSIKGVRMKGGPGSDSDTSSWSCFFALVRATCLDDICHTKPCLTGTRV
ncbi:hypothetical protein QQF64_022705 [Cirrhinus molitorella]|uniref:Uncharacterized protein n=1 Tax=Cirrhinus molitorella TaxID=172907 RepID=A0ABR3L6F2_9TELE